VRAQGLAGGARKLAIDPFLQRVAGYGTKQIFYVHHMDEVPLSRATMAPLPEAFEYMGTTLRIDTNEFVGALSHQFSMRCLSAKLQFSAHKNSGC